MPTTSIYQRVKSVTNMKYSEVVELHQIGITDKDDLRYAEFVDFPVISPVIKRRKLNMISNFLANDVSLNATITAAEIQQRLKAPTGIAAPAHQSVSPDPHRGEPRLYTDMLSNFSGEEVDYEDWERKEGDTIKQTAYKDLLDNPAMAGDVVAEARSKELYNMILSCVAGGHTLNTTEKVCDSNRNIECGYKAWIALKDWYLDLTQVDSMISHWESILESTVLDVDTSATEYINNFEMYARKLMKHGENWTDNKKVREFKKSVSDPDYDTEVRVHKGKFSKLVETVRKREQYLGRSALEPSCKNKRTRRVEFGEDDVSDDKEPQKPKKRKNKETPRGDKSSYVPFMPKCVFAKFNI